MTVPPPRLGFLLAGVVFVADQLTKWWMLAEVLDPPNTILLTPFLNVVLVLNRGVSFGMFGTAPDWMPLALVVISLAISVALALWMRLAKERLLAAGLGLVVGGALGNVVDRIRFGAVVDFLDLHWADWHWPAFNVADAAITLGVVLLLLDALKSTPDKT